MDVAVLIHFACNCDDPWCGVSIQDDDSDDDSDDFAGGSQPTVHNYITLTITLNLVLEFLLHRVFADVQSDGFVSPDFVELQVTDTATPNSDNVTDDDDDDVDI